MNLNKIFLIGRLTGDPQLRSTKTGGQVAVFSIATNRVWNDKNNQKQEQVEYHNIVVWGRQAEVASKFLLKGQMELVEGRIQTRDYEDKQGQKRKATEQLEPENCHVLPAFSTLVFEHAPIARGMQICGLMAQRPQATYRLRYGP